VPYIGCVAVDVTAPISAKKHEELCWYYQDRANREAFTARILLMRSRVSR